MACDGKYAPSLEVRKSRMSLALSLLIPSLKKPSVWRGAAFPHSMRLMQMRDHLGAIDD